MESRGKRTCRLCRQGGRICQQGFRKTHERADPACRFHGTDARGNVPVTRGEAAQPQPRASPEDRDRERTARPPQVPFEHMTRFVTRGGIGLHFLPGPLDKWIPREVRKQEGEWTDSKTGRSLSTDEKGEFRQYRRQLARRNRVGQNADKLARIVDRYLPDLANETRCYMIRYPHEVKNLLRQARRIRRRIKSRTMRGTVTDRVKRPRKTKTKERSQRGKAGDKKTAPHTATDAGEVTNRAPNQRRRP